MRNPNCRVPKNWCAGSRLGFAPTHSNLHERRLPPREVRSRATPCTKVLAAAFARRLLAAGSCDALGGCWTRLSVRRGLTCEECSGVRAPCFQHAVITVVIARECCLSRLTRPSTSRASSPRTPMTSRAIRLLAQHKKYLIRDTSSSGSFSAVSTPTFAGKNSFFSIFEIYKMCIVLHHSNLSNLANFLQHL